MEPRYIATRRIRHVDQPPEIPQKALDRLLLAAPDLQVWRILDAQKALDRNRTDDLILTMDVLCQLSYKGGISAGTVPTTRVFVNTG